MQMERNPGVQMRMDLILILCKEMTSGLTEPQKQAHEGRIVQVHIRISSIHFQTNVGPLPTFKKKAGNFFCLQGKS